MLEPLHLLGLLGESPGVRLEQPTSDALDSLRAALVRAENVDGPQVGRHQTRLDGFRRLQTIVEVFVSRKEKVVAR